MKSPLKPFIPAFKKSKNYQHLLNALAVVKQVSKSDLKVFLSEDHQSFSVLTASLKHITSTNRLTVSLSKNSARSFYLNQPKSSTTATVQKESNLKDDCLTDAQNCQFFNLFNSKEKGLWTRFHDKYESNFEGTAESRLLRFLTLTFNTTDDNQYSFTTNTDINDPCWEPLIAKKPFLKDWAPKHDPNAEARKIKLEKILDKVSQLTTANHYLAKFLRNIHLKWKPSHWKYVVVRELMKNGIWHFHLISTPIIPYTHKCNNSKDFASCWDCRAYLNELWPWGRAESRLMTKTTAKKYVAKYISKSFHLRDLYAQHGLQESSKTYTFFRNLYDYDEREALITGKSKIDQQSGVFLPPNQKVFRRTDNTYFYRTNERLIATVTKPELIKKNFRLGNRSLHSNSLLKLTKKASRKEALLLNLKNKKKTLDKDFQEFLIYQLLALAKKAEFSYLPLEQDRVDKENGNCDGLPYSHFQTKPVLTFQFAPEKVELVKEFFNQLDNYAEQYDLQEAKDFQDNRFTNPITARNNYLNHWYSTYCEDYYRQPLNQRIPNYVNY